MTVRKNKKRSKACKIWKFGDEEIKECNEYKYLGVTFKSNGSYSAHVDIIKQKLKNLTLLSYPKTTNGMVSTQDCFYFYLTVQYFLF